MYSYPLRAKNSYDKVSRNVNRFYMKQWSDIKPMRSSFPCFSELKMFAFQQFGIYSVHHLKSLFLPFRTFLKVVRALVSEPQGNIGAKHRLRASGVRDGRSCIFFIGRLLTFSPFADAFYEQDYT